MKKFFVLLALLMPFALNAQDYRHEISVSYGLLSFSNIYDMASAFPENSKFDKLDAVASLVGPVSIEYYNRVSNWFSLGLTGVYSSIEGDVVDNNKTSYHIRGRHITAMPGIKLHWLRTSGFNMYSKACIGASFNKDRENKNSVMMNFQLSPVGIEFGTHFCVFGELGFGEQGVLNLGLRAKI